MAEVNNTPQLSAGTSDLLKAVFVTLRQYRRCRMIPIETEKIHLKISCHAAGRLRGPATRACVEFGDLARFFFDADIWLAIIALRRRAAVSLLRCHFPRHDSLIYTTTRLMLTAGRSPP